MVSTSADEFLGTLDRVSVDTGVEWDSFVKRTILARFLAHLSEADPTIPDKFKEFVTAQAKDEAAARDENDFEDEDEEDEDFDDYGDDDEDDFLDDDEDEDDDFLDDEDDDDDDFLDDDEDDDDIDDDEE